MRAAGATLLRRQPAERLSEVHRNSWLYRFRHADLQFAGSRDGGRSSSRIGVSSRGGRASRKHYECDGYDIERGCCSSDPGPAFQCFATGYKRNCADDDSRDFRAACRICRTRSASGARYERFQSHDADPRFPAVALGRCGHRRILFIFGGTASWPILAKSSPLAWLARARISRISGFSLPQRLRHNKARHRLLELRHPLLHQRQHPPRLPLPTPGLTPSTRFISGWQPK